MKMYYSICYLSKSSEDLTKDDIKNLFAYSAEQNNECNVSGILLHAIGRFFQVIEGNERYLKDLYLKIKKDHRHSEIIELFNGPTAHPIFLRYNSKFNIVKSNDDLSRIDQYINENRLHPSSDTLKRILEPFVLMGME
ncbi:MULTISPECIES: BLUF domain-containing protein [Nonlabens]|uniref:BLUF domain-containing protein n=1 Tax=Nonlabens agnitus TaxID=870484 RepID=A0A2S9WQQ1_9FLAO|nr:MULTISPECIES: BLUF domain-containing protein [Nonlabens]KQC33021.1 hypothetical protein AAU57_06570 [Nonlabens sp. YIK11]PRP65824.1 hypothetical protein BST86_01320 [Nonlabens agnitus]